MDQRSGVFPEFIDENENDYYRTCFTLVAIGCHASCFQTSELDLFLLLHIQLSLG